VLYRGQLPTAYTYVQWTPQVASYLNVPFGESSGQTHLEVLMLAISLKVFMEELADHAFTLVGDNTASLNILANLTGNGTMGLITREVALLRAYSDLRFNIGHLPTEHLSLADALSRLFESAPAQWPDILDECRFVEPIRPLDLFTLPRSL